MADRIRNLFGHVKTARNQKKQLKKQIALIQQNPELFEQLKQVTDDELRALGPEGEEMVRARQLLLKEVSKKDKSKATGVSKTRQHEAESELSESNGQGYYEVDSSGPLQYVPPNKQMLGEEEERGEEEVARKPHPFARRQYKIERGGPSSSTSSAERYNHFVDSSTAAPSPRSDFMSNDKFSRKQGWAQRRGNLEPEEQQEEEDIPTESERTRRAGQAPSTRKSREYEINALGEAIGHAKLSEGEEYEDEEDEGEEPPALVARRKALRRSQSYSSSKGLGTSTAISPGLGLSVGRTDPTSGFASSFSSSSSGWKRSTSGSRVGIPRNVSTPVLSREGDRTLRERPRTGRGGGGGSEELANVKGDAGVDPLTREKTVDGRPRPRVIIECSQDDYDSQLGGFLAALSEMNDSVSTIKTNMEKMKKVYKELYVTISSEREKELNDELEALREHNHQLTKRTKLKCEELQKWNSRLKEAEKDPDKQKQVELDVMWRIRNNELNKISKELVHLISMQRDLIVEYEDRMKRRTVRELQVVDPEIKPEEVEQVLDEYGGGKGVTSDVFSTQVMRQRKVNRQTLDLLKEKRDDLRRLEKSLTELNQMFLDLSILANAQQEVIDQIQYTTAAAIPYVEAAVVDLAGTEKIVNSSRMKKILTFAIGALIVIVIVGAIAGVCALFFG
jgi:syntaxin 1B/2/3